MGEHRRREPDRDQDEGWALVEVLVLSVLVLIPIVYVLFVVIRLQAATLAVAQAARDVARVMDLAPDPTVGLGNAREIAEIGLQDQGVSTEGLSIFFVPGDGGCDGTPAPPSLTAGALWTVCVRAVVSLPGVPTVLSGTDNTVTGVHVLQVGEMRES